MSAGTKAGGRTWSSSAPLTCRPSARIASTCSSEASTSVTSFPAAASFGAYILHPAIVVALQAAIADVTLAGFAKFAVVSLLGTAAAFILAHLAGQVPGIRAIVGSTSGREASLVSGAR